MLLDHIVHFISKTPFQAVEDMEDLGLHAAIGGSHENWGTWNALLYTQNSYIEFLAAENSDLVKTSQHPLILQMKYDLAVGPGFGTICIRVDDIEALKDSLELQEYETSGVIDAQRRTASGFIRKWKMLFIKEDISERLPAPFFIHWEETDEERYEMLKNDGTVNEENLKLDIQSCEFAVEHPKKAAEQWGRILGLEISAEGRSYTLRLPNCLFVFKEDQGNERLNKVTLMNTGVRKNIVYEGGCYLLR